MTTLLRWVRRRRTELQLAARITVAGIAAFGFAQAVNLPQGYWAVFTAVLVTQASVGGSLTAARDRLVGTLGGAAYSSMIAVLIPHTEPLTVALALVVSIAPLAVLASINSMFRVAPVTAVIILLGTAGAAEGPILAALLRTLEVGLGGLVGLAVSVLVLPKRGHILMFETADRLLGMIARLADELFGGLIAQIDPASISLKHDKIRTTFDKLEAAETEANRERQTFLGTEADYAPLPRTLRRIYHDLVLVGRVVARPLPGIDAAIAARVTAEASTFFRAIGPALLRRLPPPGCGQLEDALRNLALQTMAPSPSASPDDASRRAALEFALDQLQRDVRDLAERTREIARPDSAPVKSSPS